MRESGCHHLKKAALFTTFSMCGFRNLSPGQEPDAKTRRAF
jgi:hypothetical protein